jgi:hypothetical protein
MGKKQVTTAGKMKSKVLMEFRKTIESNYKRKDSTKNTSERENLLLWFVDECPSKAGPENSMKFDDYGVKSAADYKRLKDKIISSIGLEKDGYIYHRNGAKKLEEEYEDIQSKYISRGNNQVIVFAKGEAGELDSLYIRIRNSFAHGNYFKKKKYYYLWNEVMGKESKLASIMILTFKSLKQIHSILKEFELK